MHKPLDDRFSEWNLRLLRSFFSEASQGEEVFLRIDKDFLNQIGQDIGGDAGFLKAVRAGPSYSLSSYRFVDQVLELVSLRSSKQTGYCEPGVLDLTYRGLNAPLYLPYLAALVRNSAESVSGYYERLTTDLELCDNFSSTEMALLERVWRDLRKWTEECNGKFGFFYLRRLGGYKHIGVPASQSIVKHHDLDRLPQIFAQIELRPGQDLTSEQMLILLNEARATRGLFSSSFKYALNDNEFNQPIQEIVRFTYLDWDGTVPARSGASVDENKVPNKNNGFYEIGLSLSIDSQFPLKMSPRWHLPPILDHGDFELTYSGIKWKGAFSGTEGVSAEPSQKYIERLWEIVASAVGKEHQFELYFGSFDDSESSKILLTLSIHRLWVLVPSIDALSGELQLISGSLPASGPAYLLSPPANAIPLKSYLERLSRNGEIVLAQGVPDDWVLGCIKDCSELRHEQRLLPDGGAAIHPKPHPIRFTGGRSVSRSYSRMYLSYDLPVIELDAPDGSLIVSSSGVQLSEIDDSSSSNLIGGRFKPKKRYKIVLSSNHGYTFELRALDQDGIILGRRWLKVASLNGESVEIGKAFSVNNLGKTVNSCSGLLGYSIGEKTQLGNLNEELSENFNCTIDEIGSLSCRDNERIDIYEKFLDRLAQTGSLDYGTARDLLRRLLQSHALISEPIFILLELRRLGHLELETTPRGHTVRVHAIKPTLYSLPISCSGKAIWGISGTLRLEHWKVISNERGVWSVYSSTPSQYSFTQRRLLIHDNTGALVTCERIGFQFTKMPSLEMANWSAGLEEFKKDCFFNTMESIGSKDENSMRFHVSKGIFTRNPSGRINDIWELWKVKDLDVRMEDIHVLANRSAYAFVRDPSWAKWLAINEFAFMMSGKHSCLEDIYPPPITYEAKSGKLFIPARIGLPSILERAVISCSGRAPDMIFLKSCKDGSTPKDKVGLCQNLSKVLVINANLFYLDMAEGRWFVYHYVPEYIALLIARKLGAVLDFIK